MKRTIAKIGKSGKRITAILGFITAIASVWALYKTYSTKDISGKWRMKYKVEKCNHKEYVGDIITHETVFNKSGGNIVGKGEKTEYNGNPLPADEHRLLEYTGTIDGCKLNAIYDLHGLKRTSRGSISVVISSDGKSMCGTYSGTIADDSGTVTGEKLD